MMALFKYYKREALQKFFCKKFICKVLAQQIFFHVHGIPMILFFITVILDIWELIDKNYV